MLKSVRVFACVGVLLTSGLEVALAGPLGLSQAEIDETKSDFAEMPPRSELLATPSAFTGDAGVPEALPKPPKGTLNLVKFDSPGLGELGAYISPDPGDGQKHPAIIWITGGLSNSLGEMWTPKPRSDDQSAAAYRQAGVIVMFPTLRGGNDNPGEVEWMLGEVNDIIAAARYLAAQPYVDPSRIYLGGHSTGGSLVMLVAESTDLFRATFAFGPVPTGDSHGDIVGIDFENDQPGLSAEVRSTQRIMRWPMAWLKDVKTPVFVIEGKDGNSDFLPFFDALTDNPNIQFLEVGWADHFSVLAPANEIIAQKILADDGTGPIKLDVSEIVKKPNNRSQ